MKRKRWAAEIEEMYFAGLPVRLMAEKLGLKPNSLSQYIFLNGLTDELKLRQNDLADEIIARHEEAA